MLDEWASSSRGAPDQVEAAALDQLDDKIFSVEVLKQNATKGHGIITSISASNNVVVVGTNKGWIVRHDFAADTELDLDLTTSRGGEQSVHAVFLDPAGRHCFAVLRSNTSVETYYFHAKWKKPRSLGKLKGIIINSVAWNKLQLSEASTGDVIIATQNGQLYEVVVDERDKKEKTVKLLYELRELSEPFTGIAMETIASSTSTRYFLMAVTFSKLYMFTGSGSLEMVFATYADRPMHFTELPGENNRSEIHFFGKRYAESFAWLSGSGIYHGHLNISTQISEENFIASKRLLEYTSIEEVRPLTMSLTKNHFLLLYVDKLKAVNKISQKVVEEENFNLRYDTSTEQMRGLCADYAVGAYYAYSDGSIFEIAAGDEDRDMWKVYLGMKEYSAALEHCRDTVEKDRVYEAQADVDFSAGKYTEAASFYAKIQKLISFEEIALKFVSVNEQDALRTYLLRKLDGLGKDDRSQYTMISTWATELYLDKINQLLLEENKEVEADKPKSLEYSNVVKEFKAFLTDCKDILDEATTLKLLVSYGRNEELVYFASLKDQYETVINHYIQQRNAKKVISVLRKGNVPLNLQYKFAPALVMLDAYGTVEYWMTCPTLNPRELIPALMRYSNELHKKGEPHEAIKYLEFCIQKLQNEDTTVHNLLLYFLAKQGDEKALLQFLKYKCGKGRVFYDPKYALRLCLEEKRIEACVYMYSMLGMHKEAVSLALKVNVDLAKAETEKVEGNEELRKKLWLLIAKHVIKEDKGDNIKKAIAFVKETEGLLKIEDILPFFPDFTLINDFQEPISATLQDYNKQIEELKREMNEATLGAENLRKDINMLSQRCVDLKADEECGVCSNRVLSAGNGGIPPFYVFPCGHAFHSDCLVAHIIKYVDKSKKDRIMELKKRLTVLATQSPSSVNAAIRRQDSGNDLPADAGISPIDQVNSEVDDIVAGECPYCGEMMIQECFRPFTLPDEDADVIASWNIRH